MQRKGRLPGISISPLKGAIVFLLAFLCLTCCTIPNLLSIFRKGLQTRSAVWPLQGKDHTFALRHLRNILPFLDRKYPLVQDCLVSRPETTNRRRGTLSFSLLLVL